MSILHINKFQYIFSAVTILIATLGLLSYIPGYELIGSLGDKNIPMAPSTATSFIILGISLLSLKKEKRPHITNITLQVLTFFTALFGLLATAGALIGVDLNLEDTIVPAHGLLGEIPIARMSPITGMSFFFSGIVILGLLNKKIILLAKRDPKLKNIMSVMVGFILLLSFTVTLAYTLGTPLLYEHGSTIPMALTTAVAFLFLGIAIFGSTNGILIPDFFISPSTSSIVFRIIVPFTLPTVIISEILFLTFHDYHHFNPALIVAFLTTIVLSLFVYISTLISKNIATTVDDLNKELYESQQLLIQTSSIASVGGWEIDIETHEIAWSDQTKEIYGLSDDDIFNLEFGMSFFFPEDRQKIKELIDTALKSGKGWTRDFRLKTLAGKIKWVTTIGNTETINGKTVRVYGVLQDITKRKLAEKKLQASHDLLSNLSLHLPGSLYQLQLSPDGHLTVPYASKGIIETFGVTPEEVRNDITPMLRYIHPEDSKHILRAIKHSAKTLDVCSGKFRVTLPEKETRWIMGRSKPENLGGGSILWHGSSLDITDQQLAEQQVITYLNRLKHTTENTLLAVSNVVEQRDPYTAGHERQVGDLAAAIATEMGLSTERIEGIKFSGYVHDIGKISIPAEILTKPTKLMPVEFSLIRLHPQNGYDILKNIDFVWPVLDVILQHHERMDGSGYPKGLKGDEITLEARIIAVADVVEAMSSHRPYRPGLGIEKALNELESNIDKYYDRSVVEACLRLFREQGYKLNNE